MDFEIAVVILLPNIVQRPAEVFYLGGFSSKLRVLRRFSLKHRDLIKVSELARSTPSLVTGFDIRPDHLEICMTIAWEHVIAEKAEDASVDQHVVTKIFTMHVIK